jgi:nitrogen regulatory protein P-II 1
LSRKRKIYYLDDLAFFENRRVKSKLKRDGTDKRKMSYERRMNMKLVKAYVRTFMADGLINALKELTAPRISAIDVKALGDEIRSDQLEISAELGSTYTTMVKIEIICHDEEVEKIKEAVLKHARTGYKGDGLIAISPINEAISIRTGKSEGFHSI